MRIKIDFADDTSTGGTAFVFVPSNPLKAIGLVTCISPLDCEFVKDTEYLFFTWLPGFRDRNYTGRTPLEAVQKSGILDVLAQVL